MSTESYYWLVLALSIPAFLWLCRRSGLGLAVVPNPRGVWRGRTSTTAFGPHPLPFTHKRNYAAPLRFRPRLRCGFLRLHHRRKLA